MKKIFRMALVFALAGATLMYTGCSKDYDAEINALDKDVEALRQDLSNKVADLEGKISGLTSSVSNLQTALDNLSKKVDGNAEDIKSIKDQLTTLNGKISAIEETLKGLDKYATKEELQAAVDKINSDLNAYKAEVSETLKLLTDAVNELAEKAADKEDVAAEFEEVWAAIDAVYAALGNNLTAIVFIPDFYYGGIEATSYDFLDLVPHKAVNGPAETVDHNGTDVKFPAEAILTYKADSTKLFSLGQIGKANYDINPSTFNLEDAEWALHGMDQKYVVVKGDEAAWKPVFQSIEYKDDAANGIPYAQVSYSISNPEKLSYEDNVPVMHLEATLADGKYVSSDWEAVVSGIEGIDHLAFVKTKPYKTEEPEQCDTTKMKDLYYRADTCVQHVPSYPIKYNNGPIVLDTLIAIHVLNTITDITEYTLDELNAKYPGFTFEYELVPFLSGKNDTGEEYYGIIEGNTFTPAWVASVSGKPESRPIAKDSEDGLSSVGRTPIVLVKLINSGKVVSYGYFKIEIVREAPVIEERTLGPVDFGKVPFVCEPITIGIKWFDFSHFVLEELKMDYDEFTSKYTYDEASAYELVDGEYVAVGDKYGPITYTKDTLKGTINDVFEWTIDPQEIGEDTEKTLYVKFTSADGYSILYFELTASVAKAAAFDFGANKLRNEWYDDIKGEVRNTARINVPVPTADGENDVTKFQRDLNHFFVGYTPGVELSEDSDPIYEEVADSLLETTATYTFAKDQDKIIDKEGTAFQLFTNATFDSLFVKAKFDENGKVVPDASAKADTTTLIAYFTSGESEGTDSEGNNDGEDEGQTAPAEGEEEEAAADTASIKNNVIVYSWAEGNTLAKYFLNLWGINDNSKDETMLHANVDVAITYGECEVPAGTESFHVRFLRPLDINFQGADLNEESAVDGGNVEIAKFINGITDWNHQRVIVPELDSTGAETGYYIANVIKTVDMYEYYQFDTLRIELGLAERNNWNVKDSTEWDIIKTVTPDVKLKLGTVDENDVFTAMDPEVDENGNEFYAIDISNFEKIRELVINYRNDEGYIDAFDVKIPIRIGYAWGYYEAMFEIHILDTGSTSPKKPAK